MIDIGSGLTIVIPTFNESKFLSGTVNAALAAIKKCEFPVQIVIVDDGSEDDTEIVLNKYLHLPFVKYQKKQHDGRVRARLSGIDAANFENVLMLDARVRLKVDSLINLTRLIHQYPNSRFWNGDIEIQNLELPHVSIWQTLVAAGWKDYVLNPRTCHFGIQDFDRFPKGTGLFLAPKQDWQKELTALGIEQQNSTVALSDDTRLLRNFAAESDIWMSPQFKADYIPRTGFGSFLKNGFYRGTTFIDSYWSSQILVGKIIRFGLPFVIACLIFLGILELKYTTEILVLGNTGLSLLLASYSYKCWGDVPRSIREGAVGFLFIPTFGVGLMRGYLAKITRALND